MEGQSRSPNLCSNWPISTYTFRCLLSIPKKFSKLFLCISSYYKPMPHTKMNTDLLSKTIYGPRNNLIMITINTNNLWIPRPANKHFLRSASFLTNPSWIINQPMWLRIIFKSLNIIIWILGTLSVLLVRMR